MSDVEVCRKHNSEASTSEQRSSTRRSILDFALQASDETPIDVDADCVPNLLAYINREPDRQGAEAGSATTLSARPPAMVWQQSWKTKTPEGARMHLAEAELQRAMASGDTDWIAAAVDVVTKQEAQIKQGRTTFMVSWLRGAMRQWLSFSSTTVVMVVLAVCVAAFVAWAAPP